MLVVVKLTVVVLLDDDEVMTLGSKNLRDQLDIDVIEGCVGSIGRGNDVAIRRAASSKGLSAQHISVSLWAAQHVATVARRKPSKQKKALRVLFGWGDQQR